MNRKPISSLGAEQLARMQHDWRAGLLPPRTIAVKFGVDVDELRIYAADHEWQGSELTQQIVRETERAVVERTVSDHRRAQGEVQSQLIDNRQLVQQFGQILAGITQEQQTEVSTTRRYVLRLLRDLERLEPPEVDEAAVQGVAALIAEENPDLAKQLAGLAQANTSAERVKDIEKRASIIMKLVPAVKMLIEVERLVWGMGKVGNTQTNDYDALLEYLIQVRNQEAGIG